MAGEVHDDAGDSEKVGIVWVEAVSGRKDQEGGSERKFLAAVGLFPPFIRLATEISQHINFPGITWLSLAVMGFLLIFLVQRFYTYFGTLHGNMAHFVFKNIFKNEDLAARAIEKLSKEKDSDEKANAPQVVEVTPLADGDEDSAV